MELVVIGKQTMPDMVIDSYPIYKVDNVKSINIVDGNHSHIKWNEFEVLIEDQVSGEHFNYFNMNCLFNEAFGHWVLEVAIFLGIYKNLKKQIPNLKLYMPNFRHFKMAFLNAFDIPKDVIAETIQPNNTCFFTDRISHNDSVFNETYKVYLDNFISYFHSNVEKIQKDIDLIYMPRGRRENYVENDRRITNEDNIELLLKDKYNSIVFNADNAPENFIDQVKLINRAKIVVLTYGSAFFVNGCMLKNCKILVLDKIESQFNYPYMRFLRDYIAENNTINFIPKEQLHNLDYIKSIIDSYQ